MGIVVDRWSRFFKALGVNTGLVDTSIGPCLFPHLWKQEDGRTTGCYWYVGEEAPLSEELVAAARCLADSNKEHVYLPLIVGDVNGPGVFGPPMITSRMTRRKGKKRQLVEMFGICGLSFAPPDSTNGERPFKYCDPRMCALQEDFWGGLDIWPLYVERLPLRQKTYTLNGTCPTIDGGFMPCVYVGCGRTPNGPRLSRAYEAALCEQ